MDLETNPSASCYGVRRLFLPQTAKIVIAVLAALVISINLLAMISVLRNYRRLRQRIYVFVINLALANILAGAIFFTDVIVRYFVAEKEEIGTDDAIFTSEDKYIKLTVDVENILSQELLETFKAGVVVLSVLNTALVTFALYKRTTSMGRHHEDFRNVSGTVGPDGHSFLPAFDTMMRVLSIGSPAATNGLGGKNLARGGKNGDYSPSRRMSTSSRTSSSPQRKFSFSKDPDSVLLDKYRSEQNPGMRNPRVVRVSLDSTARKPSYQSEKQGKRSGSVSRLMSTGRRVSHAIRSRSVSGNQSYVGRHSYSVMSKSATGSSLAFIWIVFAATCAIPLVLRRTGITGVVCPGTCRNVEVLEMIKLGNEQVNIQDANGLVDDVSRKSIPKATSSNATETQNDDQQINTSVITTANSEGILSQDAVKLNKSSNDTNSQSSGNLVSGFAVYKDIGNCAPANYEYVSNSNKEGKTSSIKSIGSATIVEKLQDEDFVPTTSHPTPHCSSCSSAFFPLSKSHMIFIALMIFITWCWLIVSASRLLYLRKHSNNVFVRCSALWRFMFMNATFFFFTLAPYVIWIIVDFATASPVTKSPLWYSNNSNTGENNNAGIVANDEAEKLINSEARYETIYEDVYNLHPVYAVFATCLMLINFAVAPSLYLIRLLGFRRIVSALHLRT